MHADSRSSHIMIAANTNKATRFSIHYTSFKIYCFCCHLLFATNLWLVTLCIEVVKKNVTEQREIVFTTCSHFSMQPSWALGM